MATANARQNLKQKSLTAQGYPEACADIFAALLASHKEICLGRLAATHSVCLFIDLPIYDRVMEQRKARRVMFERGYAAHMMAIDGTWRRDCKMHDVSDTGAQLSIEGSIEGLQLKEFFLLLSSTGLAYRRCQLAWVNGDRIGVYFLIPGKKNKKQHAAASH